MASSGKILIVEDQYFVAVDCEMHLESAGFECVGLATNSDEAVQLAGDQKPDLVLMDIHLAGPSDGVDAAIQIFRELGIRSIFTSAHADSVIREHAREAEPFGWLPKPYSNADLLRVVQDAMTQLDRHDQVEHSPPLDSRLQ